VYWGVWGVNVFILQRVWRGQIVSQPNPPTIKGSARTLGPTDRLQERDRCKTFICILHSHDF